MLGEYSGAQLVVAPGEMALRIANAEVIHQMTVTRKDQFPKYTALYESMGFFGDNLLCTEGAIWRMHRKATSGSFSERNASLVFHEAVVQAQGMLATWADDAEGTRFGGKTITTMEEDTMRLALNVIGFVGFGLRLLWPGQTLPSGTDPKLVKYGSLDAPPGRHMSFVDATAKLLENLFVVIGTPEWLLRKLLVTHYLSHRRT